jgi:hypothetical protein
VFAFCFVVAYNSRKKRTFVMDSAVISMIAHLDSNRSTGLNFGSIGHLGMVCRATRDVVDDLPIWGIAATKLGWSQPTTRDERRVIKARVMFLVRWAPRKPKFSAREEISNWVWTGKRDQAAISVWPRMNDGQRLARLLIATPNAAKAIVGSGGFTPSVPLLQVVIGRGIRFSPGNTGLLFKPGWSKEMSGLLLDNMDGGPESHHLVVAVRAGRADLFDLFWERGVRPTQEQTAEILSVEGPLADTIAERLAEDSRPASPEGTTASSESDGEPPLKRSRNE